MTAAPDLSFFNVGAERKESVARIWFTDLVSWIDEMPGGSLGVELTISAGDITPAKSIHFVETEAAASTDNLDHMLLTNHAEGKRVLLYAADDTHTVVVRHAQGGSGQFLLIGNANFSMDTDEACIEFVRIGNDWWEMWRSPESTALTGDVTGSSSTGSIATTIANNAVTDAKLRDSAATSVIGRSAATSGDPGDISFSADGDVLRRDGTTVSAGKLKAASFSTGPGIVTPSMLDNGSARSVLGVTGNASAARADIQASAADQVMRANAAGTAVAFGAIDLSKSAAATGVLQAASMPALTGDVTTVAGALASTIANNAVSNAKLAQIATSIIKGRATASTGNVEDLTATQVRTILGMGDAYALNKASTSDLLSGTANVMSMDNVEAALAYSALTPGTTVTPNMNSARRFTLTPAQNFTLANPSNLRASQDVVIVITQDGTGSRLLSAVGSAWKFPGGVPTLSTAAGAIDVITGVVQSGSLIRAVCNKAFA